MMEAPQTKQILPPPMEVPVFPQPKKPLISDLTMMDMQVGWLIGILLGIIGSAVFILWLVEMHWVFKLLSLIGFIGMIGNICLGLYQTLKQRKAYINGQNQIKEMFRKAAEYPSNQKEMSYVG